jgi:hypothetical protein
MTNQYPYDEKNEREKVLAGLLCWNKAKAANYCNCTIGKLLQACRDKKIVPDVITHWHCKQVFWFTQLTLDGWLADIERARD